MAAVHPPVSGDWIEVVSVPLPVDAATTWATTAGSGAVVVFLGVVRDHADGRSGVTGLTYEAYEEEAVTKLAAVAAEARRQWPVIDRVALLHRIGDLELSDTAVAVVVSSPHRAEAFEAGAVLHRHPEGVGPDLEARALGGWLRLGHRCPVRPRGRLRSSRCHAISPSTSAPPTRSSTRVARASSSTSRPSSP